MFLSIYFLYQSVPTDCQPKEIVLQEETEKQFSDLFLGLFNVHVLELFFPLWKADQTLPNFLNCTVELMLLCTGYVDFSSNILNR